MRGVFGYSILAVFVWLGLALGAAEKSSVKIEVQAVKASDPGKKHVSIPDSLAKHKTQLSGMPFGTFKDAGAENVKATAAQKGSTTLNNVTLEIELNKIEKDKAKVTVGIKDGQKKEIGKPISYNIPKGKSVSIEVPDKDKDSPTIFILTLEGIE